MNDNFIYNQAYYDIKKNGGSESAAINAAKKAVATYRRGTYKKKPADLILEVIKGVK